jgi:hypothetical protein
MSAGAGRELRLLFFGDATGSVWGAALDAGAGAFVVRTPDGITSAAGPSAVQIDTDGPRWRVSGESFDLSLTPVAPPGLSDRPDGDELCQVEGRLHADGAGRDLTCLGTRSQDLDADLRGVGSLRALSGWFSESRGLVLRALRPAASRGQEEDRLQATLFDAEAWVAVAESRLSTTFGPDEQPDRASLELWVGDDEEQYPRRAAAEATGAAIGVQGEGVRMDVTPLACHCAGLDGPGVYLIAHL